MKRLLALLLVLSLAGNAYLILSHKRVLGEPAPAHLPSVAAQEQVPPSAPSSPAAIQPAAPPPTSHLAPSIVATAESQSVGILGLVGQLKRFAQLHPEWTLPEFALLSDEDWLDMAKHMEADTDEDARRGLHLLRQLAKQRAADKIRAGAALYAKDHDGRYPSDPKDLVPYLTDDAALEALTRYVPKGMDKTGLCPVYSDTLTTDPVIDTAFEFDLHDGMAMHSTGAWTEIIARFKAQHPNERPTPESLRPFLGAYANDPYIKRLLRDLH